MKLIIKPEEAELMISQYVSQQMQLLEFGSFPKVTFLLSELHFVVEPGDDEDESED